ncbi:MAG TPA: putative porin [Verrucomicrobiae bacterium]|nr:putative porin [Verrucomicrobiae bacterium]
MLAVCATSVAWGAEPQDPLLDLFVKKGYVTQDEADKVNAEAEAMRTNEMAQLPASKWKINKAIKSVELFGDLRLRYEDRSAEDPRGGSVDLNRLRYAVRIGLRGDVYDNFYYGVRAETSTNPRSTWVTFGSSSSAPFGKSSAGIGIGQVYLGWHPTDWADITVGKMPNPFYTTAMTWDPDLSPEGAAERFKYTVGPADLFASFGQFLYQDPNPTHANAGYFSFNYKNSNLPFILGWQLGVNYHVTKTISFKVAPAIYNYTGNGVNNINGTSPDFSGTFVGQGSTKGLGGNSAFYNLGPYDGFFSNETGINDLLILDVPWELNAKVKNLDVRLFGDYAQNLNGGDRARAAFGAQSAAAFNGSGISLIPSAQTGDDKAYQIGLAIGNKNSLGLVSGSVCKKNAWELRTYWQHVEQYSLDPNLIDSDFFADLNMEGIYTALAYGLSDNFIATIRYGYASRINDKLGTGGSNQDIPQVNPYNHYNLLQLDLTMRF